MKFQCEIPAHTKSTLIRINWMWEVSKQQQQQRRAKIKINKNLSKNCSHRWSMLLQLISAFCSETINTYIHTVQRSTFTTNYFLIYGKACSSRTHIHTTCIYPACAHQLSEPFYLDQHHRLLLSLRHSLSHPTSLILYARLPYLSSFERTHTIHTAYEMQNNLIFRPNEIIIMKKNHKII